jgi:hypothetical protein
MNIESVSVKCESGEPYTFFYFVELGALTLTLTLAL